VRRSGRDRIWLILIGFSVAYIYLRTGGGDFIEYWSAVRVFLAGENPYDPRALLPVQQAAGWDRSEPLMMWNPPWTLLMMLPFATLPFELARALFLAISSAVTLGVADYLWRVFGGLKEDRWIAWAGTWCFIPTIHALAMGQVSPMLLAGITGFVWAIRKEKEWLAGLFLVLATVKLHVVYLFFLVVFVWGVKHRKWKVLLAPTLGILAGLSLLTLYSPQLIPEYLSAIGSGAPLDWRTPTLGTILRLVLGGSSHLQFLPPLLLGGTSLLYLAVLRRHFLTELSWTHSMAPILALSVASSSFAWTFDMLLLTPAVLWILIRFLASPSRRGWVLGGLLCANLLTVAVMWFIGDYLWTFWLPWAIVLLYWSSRDRTGFRSQLETE
jgi:hypothetical protein